MEKIILMRYIFYNDLTPLKSAEHCWVRSYPQGKHITENKTWELWVTKLRMTQLSLCLVYTSAWYIHYSIAPPERCCGTQLQDSQSHTGGGPTSFSLFSSRINTATSSWSCILLPCMPWMAEDVSKGQGQRLGVGGCLASWGFLGTSVHRCI